MLPLAGPDTPTNAGPNAAKELNLPPGARKSSTPEAVRGVKSSSEHVQSERPASDAMAVERPRSFAAPRVAREISPPSCVHNFTESPTLRVVPRTGYPTDRPTFGGPSARVRGVQDRPTDFWMARARGTRAPLRTNGWVRSGEKLRAFNGLERHFA